MGEGLGAVHKGEKGLVTTFKEVYAQAQVGFMSTGLPCANSGELV